MAPIFSRCQVSGGQGTSESGGDGDPGIEGHFCGVHLMVKVMIYPLVN